MIISSEVKNRIERELKRMKADPSTKGKRAAEIILVAAGRPVHHTMREKLEKYLAEGISPNRIETAISMVAEHLSFQEGQPHV